MVRPFDDFDTFAEKEEAKREGRYAEKILKIIIDSLLENDSYHKLRREAGDEFGFRWFNEHYHATMAMDAANISVKVFDLLRTGGITKTELWQRYFDLRGEYGSPFALVFRLPGLGNWVIHDSTGLEYLPGFPHIVRVSEQRNAQLTMQPLQALILAMGKADA